MSLPGIKKKTIVGLAVTPSLGLEATVFDQDTKEVVKYSYKHLEYSIASRSIQDINTFRSAVIDLFSEIDVKIDSANIFIVLPNVHFGFRNFDDTNMPDEEIEAVLLSEATESYIFKQEEPVCAFVDMNEESGATSKYVAYSVIQKKVIEEIQDAIADLGGNLVGIESAPSAIPRAVSITGVCDEVISDNRDWNILLINPNNYAIYQMSGSRILDYAEIPFAIMSFEGNEVYPAIASSVTQYLSNYSAEKLVIVSQADNVSASTLKGSLNYDKPIVTFDSNSFSKEPCISVGGDVLKQRALGLSLCAIASAAPKFGKFSTLNVLGITGYDGISVYGTVNIAGKEVEITSALVLKLCIVSSILFAIIALVVCIPLFGTAQYNSTKAKELQTQVDGLNGEITTLEGKIKKCVGSLVKQIGESNKQMMNYYDSLSNDIPPQVWLTYYVNKDGKEVGIEGLSVDINQVYQYFKSLKTLSPTSDIKLNKLEVFKKDALKNNKKEGIDNIVLDDDDSQQIFSFEISNTTYSKTFDEFGNKAEVTQNGAQGEGGDAPQAAPSVPKVPDVDPNLKEAK